MTDSLNRDIATGIAAFFVTVMLILAGAASDRDPNGVSAGRNAPTIHLRAAQTRRG